MKFLKRIFQRPKVLLADEPFDPVDYTTIHNFLQSEAGRKLIRHLLIQRIVIADRTVRESDAVRWQGYCLGYKAAIDALILQFQQSAVNDTNTESDGIPALEDFDRYMQEIDKRK